MPEHTPSRKDDSDLTWGLKLSLGLLLLIASVTVVAAVLYAVGVRL